MLTQQNQIMQAVVAQNVVTMSTREIADLTGKRHDHVMVDVRKMLSTLKLHAPDFSGTYTTHQGNIYDCFHLPKRETLILVSGYNLELRATIIDRWQELEAGFPTALPQTLPEALRLAADLAEQKAIVDQKLLEAAPKVQFVDKYVDTTGLKAFREVCKILQANESRFREFLADSKIMYRLNGTWVPYQNHIDAGRLSVKTGVANHNGHAFTDVKFTPKGLNWVAGEWAKHQIQGEVA